MIPHFGENHLLPFQGRCWPAMIFLLLPMLLTALFSKPLAAAAYKQGTILVPELNLRSGPGLHHPSIAILPQGAEVLIISHEGEWVRILAGEQSGFILNRSQYLRMAPSVVDPGAASATRDNRAKQVDALTRELNHSREMVTAYSKEEKSIINELDQTEKTLDNTRKKVARLSAELKAAEKQILDIEGQFRELEQRAEATELYVAERLAALYKLSWLGKFNALASAESMFDFFCRKRAMEQVLAQDEALMTQLAGDKAEMRTLLAQSVARKDEKQAKTADLNAKIDAMNAEKVRREALLTKIRGKKDLQLAAIESLKASAQELDRTVAGFKKLPRPAASPDQEVTEKPFAALKGLLMMPVKGKIISFFGHYKNQALDVTNFQSGINIKADRGEPIRAVYSGITLYASWFRGFGNMIIIDHGDHYYTVYAHLEEQFKSKGDPVETGEVIATVGDTGALTGTGLHFEIRHHGKPMNPLGWIKKG